MALDDGKELIVLSLEHPLSYFEEVIDNEFYVDKLLRLSILSVNTTYFSLADEQKKSI